MPTGGRLPAMEITFPHLLFLDPEQNRRPERRRAGGVDAQPKKDRRLYCIRCRHQVTHEDERIPMRGGNEHTFTNPHGFVFHIGCFRNARGCAPVGTPTLEHTWFPGYAWRIALCASCETHLGWGFGAAADRFYGLIVDRLSTSPAKN